VGAAAAKAEIREAERVAVDGALVMPDSSRKDPKRKTFSISPNTWISKSRSSSTVEEKVINSALLLCVICAYYYQLTNSVLCSGGHSQRLRPADESRFGRCQGDHAW